MFYNYIIVIIKFFFCNILLIFDQLKDLKIWTKLPQIQSKAKNSSAYQKFMHNLIEIVNIKDQKK